jgi:phenylalanyl-tRNA synthetase beta chain
MHIALAWLNSLLDRPVTAEEAERALTFVGFPLESITPLPGVGGAGGVGGGGGDALLDVEVTSNRGDCLSHVGVAREVAAALGRTLKVPFTPSAASASAAPSGHGAASGSVVLENQVPGPQGCPLFSLRVIRGVKIGPSPQWLQDRLVAVGQRPINNVVDATNYVSFELGNPSHVFDLATLRKGPDGKPRVVVRGARAGEKLALLDGKTVELKAGELVVADAERAVSLAGIMGGAESAVSDRTTDVLLEVATWVPGLVRKAARRLQIRTDASYRFERFVDPRTVAAASERLVALLAEIAGGKAEPELLLAGLPLPSPGPIILRPARARMLLGVNFDDARLRRALEAQAIVVTPESAERWACSPPSHRPDLTIEQDLIEEIARTIGLDQIPVHDRVPIAVAPPQAAERGVRELARVLTGLGFEETVTFSFVSEKAANPFVAGGGGGGTLAVSDERRKGEGTLRPSVLPSLLACRRVNQDHRAAEPGSVRLFELASVFSAAGAPNGHSERRVLALLLDVPARDPETGSSKMFDRRRAGVRLMRGVVERVIESLHGPGVRARIDPFTAPGSAFDASATASVHVGSASLGHFGLIADAVAAQHELAEPVVAAELDLAGLLAAYPPRSLVRLLPEVPAVERDLNIVMDWSRRWAELEAAVEASVRAGEVRFVEDYRYVSLFADPKAPGKKRVLVRFHFREPTRTLTGEEVEAQITAIREKVVPKIGQPLDEFLKQA